MKFPIVSRSASFASSVSRKCFCFVQNPNVCTTDFFLFISEVVQFTKKVVQDLEAKGLFSIAFCIFLFFFSFLFFKKKRKQKLIVFGKGISPDLETIRQEFRNEVSAWAGLEYLSKA